MKSATCRTAPTSSDAMEFQQDYAEILNFVEMFLKFRVEGDQLPSARLQYLGEQGKHLRLRAMAAINKKLTAVLRHADKEIDRAFAENGISENAVPTSKLADDEVVTDDTRVAEAETAVV